MVIECMIREIYGRTLIYPVSATAKMLCLLTGKKTFSVSDIRIIESLGIRIEYLQLPLDPI